LNNPLNKSESSKEEDISKPKQITEKTKPLDKNQNEMKLSDDLQA